MLKFVFASTDVAVVADQAAKILAVAADYAVPCTIVLTNENKFASTEEAVYSADITIDSPKVGHMIHDLSEAIDWADAI